MNLEPTPEDVAAAWALVGSAVEACDPLQGAIQSYVQCIKVGMADVARDFALKTLQAKNTMLTKAEHEMFVDALFTLAAAQLRSH